MIQLVYQQVENYVVYPIVYRQAVELSGFTTIVAVLIAGSLLGVVGAILAVPFAAVIKTVLHEAGGAAAGADGGAARGLARPQRSSRSSMRASWAVSAAICCASSWLSAGALRGEDRHRRCSSRSGIRLTPVIISTAPTIRPCGRLAARCRRSRPSRRSHRPPAASPKS